MLSHSIFPLVIFIISPNVSRVMFLIDKMFLVLNSTFLSWHFWFNVLDILWFLQFYSRCSSVSDFWHTGHRSDPLLLIFFSHAFERTWPNLSMDIWTSCFLGKSKYFMFVEQCFPTFFQPRHTFLEPLTRRHTAFIALSA